MATTPDPPSRLARWLDDLWHDARIAARNLRKYPIACGVAVISLAGGIGATTATLSLRDAVFRKPPPLYRDAATLSRVQVGSPERPIAPLGSYVPGALLTIWRRQSASAVAGATPERTHNLRTATRTEQVTVRGVTPDFFAVLGVDAALGQTFSTGRLDAGPVPAVLSHRVWEALFDRRADIVGTPIWIDDRPHVVAGVLPDRFWFATMRSAVWTPLDNATLQQEAAIDVVVRRAPGVSADTLARQLEPGLAQYTAGLPAGERQLRLRVSGLEGTPLGQSMSIALPWLLGAAVLLTLLIACANVSILVIAQWTAREQEIAIRASLGASRGRIVRALVAESLLIAASGGALGIAVTLALRGLIVYRAGPALRFYDLSLDPAILIEALALTVIAGLVSGLGPALLETGRLHANPLQTLAAPERARQRWRHALVVVEIAVTVALLVVTATMIDGYRRHFTNDVGYRTRPLLLLRVDNTGGVPIARVRDALLAQSGVAAADASTSVPYFASGPLVRVSTTRDGSPAVVAERAASGADFFATLDVPMRAGRAFAPQEQAAARTAIVNETLARSLAPGGDAVGRELWIGDVSYDVVGIVADYKNAAFQPRERDAKLYLPLPRDRTDAKRVEFLVRTSSDPAALLQTLRRTAIEAAPGNAVAGAVTVDQIIAVGGQEILAGTAPLGPLVATGMLLTSAGIYGVLAFAIARRSRELALRVAIGASGRDLVRLVTAHSLRLVAAGTVAGVGVTFGLTRVVRATGGGGSFFDPAWPAFALPVAIILGVGALATWIPSRRVLRIDPAVLLRIG